MKFLIFYEYRSANKISTSYRIFVFRINLVFHENENEFLCANNENQTEFIEVDRALKIVILAIIILKIFV